METKARPLFIGRRAELDRLANEIESGAIGVIVGFPGVGKSALARQVALRLLPRFAGGSVACPVGEARSGIDLCVSLARALDVSLSHLQATRPMVTRLARALRARGATLLIVDGIEQPTSTLVTALRDVARQAPEARFIVTSRTRLAKLPQHELQLAPLGCPRDAGSDAVAASEAAQLLRAIMRQRDPVWDLEPGVMTRLVNTLGGIPLAIELAAAMLTYLPAVEVLRRLEAERVVAKYGKPDQHDNLASFAPLHAAIAGNLATLPEVDRVALAECTVFAGEFDAEAAEAVLRLPAGDSVFALLGRLEHACLVSRVSEANGDSALVPASAPVSTSARFVLPQPLQRHVRRSLARIDRELCLRHAVYYCEAATPLAEQLGATAAFDVRTRLTRYEQQLRQIFDRARNGDELPRRFAAQAVYALAPLLVGTEPARSFLAMLEEALCVRPDRDADGDSGADNDKGGATGGGHVRAILLRYRAETRFLLGDGAGAREDLQAAMQATAASPFALARVAHFVGDAHRYLGELDKARALYEMAGRAAEQMGDHAIAVAVLADLATVYRRQGDLARAEDILTKAQGLARRADLYSLDGWLLTGRGMLAAMRGDMGEARSLLVHAVTHLRAHHEIWRECYALGVLTAVHNLADELTEATACAEQLLEAALRHGYLPFEMDALANLGFIHESQGDLRAARVCYAKAIATASRLANDGDTARCLAGLCCVEAKLGKLEVAERLLARAEELAGKAPQATGITLSCARVYLELARAKESDTVAEKAVEILAQPSPPFQGGDEAVLWRLVRRTLTAAIASRSQAPAQTWRIGRAGRWFVMPGGAERIDLSRRRALSRILHALAEHRLRNPGAAMSADALVAAGWTGEPLVPRAARMRLHTAVATLRRMGLRELLLQSEDGYCLDESAAVTIESW